MKILVLSPHAELWKRWIPDLQGLGLVPLLTENASVAWAFLQFHGSGIELAVIHREGAGGLGDEGLQLATRIRKDAAYSKIPIILTSDGWQEMQFLKHQESPEGFNAYLSFPHELEQLFDRVEGVLGVGRGELRDGRFAQALDAARAPRDFHSSTDTRVPHGEAATESDIVREEVSAVFKLEEQILQEEGTSRFRLERPPTPDADPIRSAADRERREREVVFQQEQHQRDAEELPYLFGGDGSAGPSSVSAGRAAMDLGQGLPIPGAFAAAAGTPAWSLPIGNSIIPGASAAEPDVETLKRYLALREQDVAALGAQLRAALQQSRQADEQVRVEKARAGELSATLEAQKSRIEQVEQAKTATVHSYEAEIARLRGELRGRVERTRQLEMEVQSKEQEVSKVKDRVRQDLRLIRAREKELETQLEILKQEADARIRARESTLVGLKRKLDLLEFNMDILQEQVRRERETSDRLKQRLTRVAEAVKAAGGLLGGPLPSSDSSSSSLDSGPGSVEGFAVSEEGGGMASELSFSSEAAPSMPSDSVPTIDFGGTESLGGGTALISLPSTPSAAASGSSEEMSLEVMDAQPGPDTGLIQLDLPDDENKAS
jgi:hypothetical protein